MWLPFFRDHVYIWCTTVAMIIRVSLSKPDTSVTTLHILYFTVCVCILFGWFVWTDHLPYDDWMSMSVCILAKLWEQAWRATAKACDSPGQENGQTTGQKKFSSHKPEEGARKRLLEQCTEGDHYWSCGIDPDQWVENEETVLQTTPHKLHNSFPPTFHPYHQHFHEEARSRWDTSAAPPTKKNHKTFLVVFCFFVLFSELVV